MLIYAKHNFTSNFLNAIGYNDRMMSDDIIIDEVARLIVDDKKDVVNLLRRQGINVTVNDNNQYIANSLVDEVKKKNDIVINKIADMITEKSFDTQTALTFAAAKKKAEGDKTKVGAFIDKLLKNEEVQEAASTIVANVLKNTFSSANKSQTDTNTQVLDERLNVAQMYSDNQAANKRKIWTIVGITGGVVLITAVAIIIIASRRNRTQAAKLADGGDITQNVPVDGGEV